jgi:hypothetical protein
VSRERLTQSAIDARAVTMATGLVVLVTASAVATSWLVGTAVQRIAGDKMAPWILGRSSGITSYLLLVALVAFGLVLSHPARSRIRVPSSTTRIRAHVSLSVFTLVFTVLHIVVLATDQYAKVGWWGAFVPMGSEYRPLPVTLGVIGFYAGIAAGLTAALAGRVARRVWWPVHKVAIVSLVLVWLHGVLAGIDTPALLSLYVVTGGLLMGLAWSRYTTPGPRDEVAELARVRAAELTGRRADAPRAVVLPQPTQAPPTDPRP